MNDENRFLTATKRILAERAGYMCSLCGKLTIGPSKESDESISLSGEAAHIHSANPGGRRYNQNMTPEERRHISNGIWLCRNHHKTVDSDESEYSAPFLISIRRNHEKRIKLLNDGINVETGIITKLSLKNIAHFKTKAEIEFGNITLIFGPNGTGKTLITDFIASLQFPQKIRKWKSRRNQGSSNVKLEYYDSAIKEYGINYSSKNNISFSFNGSVVPAVLSPFECFYFEKDFIKDYHNSSSIAKSLSKYFKVKESQIKELINYINKEDKHFINEIYFEGNELKVMMTHSSPDLRFEALSSGEQYRVVIEIGLRLAEFYSKYKPVVVVLEHTAIGSMDFTGVNRILESVKNRNSNFQFVFTSLWQKEKFNYQNYLTYELNFDNANNNEVKITMANIA